MSLRHRILSWSYHPLRAAKALGRPFGLSSKNRLRVLLYHDIAPNEHAQFAAQLRWLARRWTFVTPRAFAAMVTGDEPIGGSKLLLTFDDGFSSNRAVAEEVLDPMGIRALFFVVSDFVGVEDRREAQRFVVRQIGMWGDNDIPAHVTNMSWSDLEALLEQGHVIGAHTRSHARLSGLGGEPLDREITGAADNLARRLGTPIEHFAYTFGDLASFSESALAAARRRFRFVYSGLRGDNAQRVSPFALRRDSLHPRDSLALVGAFLEGAADFHYARSRAELDLWLSAERN